MKARTPKTLLSAIVVTYGLIGSAAVIEVPANHTTIMGAIQAADDGDTIRVAPGTYTENLDFLGKRITLASHFESGGDWGIVRSTVIDGGDPLVSNAASTVTFQSSEGRETILQGFTVTGGRGTEWIDPSYPSYTWKGGGGVFCFQASPTIKYTVITGNEVTNDGDVDGAQGGGMLTFRSDPLVLNSIIVGNSAEYGGGLVVDYSGATIRNTIISHNTGGRSYGGGGIWTIGDSEAPILIENSAIVDNTSPTLGGALYVWSSTVEVVNSILWGNWQALDGPVKITGGGTVTMSYCNIEGGYEGTGNINSNPRFLNSRNCVLGPHSTCIDAGDPSPAFADPENPSRPGHALWPARGELRNDIGPYGGPGSQPMGRPPIFCDHSGAAESPTDDQ